MPDDKMTPQAFALSIKTKYPQYADVPDGVLVSKVLEKYPQYKEKLSLGAQPAPAEPSGLRRGWEQFKAFGPPGIAAQAMEAGKAMLTPSGFAKTLVGGPGLQMMEQGVGLLKAVPEAAKFYSGLTPGGYGAKGTITEKGTP